MKNNKLKKRFLLTSSLLLVLTTPFPVALANSDSSKKAEVNVEKVVEEAQPTFELASEAAILYDMNLNKVIYEKNPDAQAPTASLAKVMTMSIASEKLKDGSIKKDDMVSISEKAWKTYGSRMFLEVGREVPFSDIFKGIAIVSGNDASVAMAEHVAGSTEEFVKLMNAKAQSLGMTNTNFVSPNGLPLDKSEKNTDMSTARDLSLLATDYVTKYPENLEIHKTKSFAFDVGRGKIIEQQNRNPLLADFAGADGLKTGFVEGHYNLIGTAARDGIRLVVVLMTAPNEKARAKDASTLLQYGFDQYKKISINKAGDDVGQISVYKSKVREVKLSLAADVAFAIHTSNLKELKEEIILPKYLKGGLKKGDVVGQKVIYSGDKKVHTTDIIIEKDLPKSNLLVSFFHSIAIFFNWMVDGISGWGKK